MAVTCASSLDGNAPSREPDSSREFHGVALATGCVGVWRELQNEAEAVESRRIVSRAARRGPAIVLEFALILCPSACRLAGMIDYVVLLRPRLHERRAGGCARTATPTRAGAQIRTRPALGKALLRPTSEGFAPSYSPSITTMCKNDGAILAFTVVSETTFPQLTGFSVSSPSRRAGG